MIRAQHRSPFMARARPPAAGPARPGRGRRAGEQGSAVWPVAEEGRPIQEHKELEFDGSWEKGTTQHWRGRR